MRARGQPSTRTVCLACLLMVASGCGTVNRAMQARVAAEAAGIEPAVEDDAAVLRIAASTAETGLPPAEAVSLPAEAGLDDYVRVALQRNPAIRRAIRQVQVLGFQVPQVTSLDDPLISVIPPTGDMTETAAGMMNGAVGVSQKLPFPGKLSARGRIVEEAVRMAFAALADSRIATVAEVQRAYAGYYLADMAIQVTRQSQDLLRQIRDVAAARYRAGTATQQDVLRAEVELYNLTNQLITLAQQRATAVARLNSLMDRPVDGPLPPPRAVELAKVEWQLSAAMDRAVESNPRLERARAQIRRDIETIKLARLDYFPDVTVGYSYTFISGVGISPVRTGDDVWNLAFGLNLPIWWQRLRARVLEANAQTLASVEEYAELRNLLFFQLQDTLVKVDTQYRQAVLYKDLIVPRAWQAVEVSASAYRSGALEFTALIDNWRKWLDFSLAFYHALAELEQRFADFQQLIGVPVPRSAATAPAPEAVTPAGRELAGRRQ